MFHSDDFFRQFPIFKDLTEDELNRLKDISIEKTYKPDEVLFRQSEPRKAVYFILSGLIKVYKVSSDGKEQVVNVLHSNEMFPHVGFFDDTPYPAAAVTITDVQLLSVPIEDFEMLLIEKPNMAIKVMKVIGKKLLALQERLQSIQTQDVFHRLVVMLAQFVNELGEQKSDNEILLELPITNTDLASMIGVSRETVNRVINRLKKEGVITYNRKEIHILDYRKLIDYTID
ncbi:Crp/Fnr family transcriptional regulator [Tenuibacillus multivorans]|uniref:CRP/FNR family transcriptional regulator, anaerobic regulatory protein n=1 Tax=Tenuibacillus multivorans TaxID=237069 RepID=A0A1H0B2D0_9BACI|nr:Crp/Fnr family transcriptional regulator [Tenuibacillus multivorans]GEL77557.1 Crp/Fnr family transcriptional regulator [Tenuibacillus multivorans]SDN39818.1 CRP/FNR family transcriptional regulator, anaerobic regulatory protein [Tenuibacillus multivorans]